MMTMLAGGLLLATTSVAVAPAAVAPTDVVPAAVAQVAATQVSVPVTEVASTCDVASAELWVEANAAYEAGSYPRASELYRELSECGVDGGKLHYNRGNALLRQGELGSSVAAYRESLVRLPRDEDARANLEFARRSAKDALESPGPPPLLEAVAFWHYGLSRAEIWAAVLVANLLFWCLLVVRLFVRDSELLRWARAILLVVLIALAGSLLVRLVAPAEIAVITAPELEVHAGIGAETLVRFTLHSGSEVRLVDVRDGWLRIRLPDGEQGWIDGRYAQRVTL